MGRNVDAIKIKRCHFGASVLILAVELFKFGRTYIVDYDAIDVGSWLKLVIVITLFVISRSWLLRLSGWVSILLAVLLPFDIFPPFGDEVEVPTVHGKVKLKIPSGTQTGTKFRLKGKGVPNVRGYGIGDQHVIIRIITPTKLTEKQKQLLREFDENSSKSHEESIFSKVKRAFKGE